MFDVFNPTPQSRPVTLFHPKTLPRAFKLSTPLGVCRCFLSNLPYNQSISFLVCTFCVSLCLVLRNTTVSLPIRTISQMASLIARCCHQEMLKTKNLKFRTPNLNERLDLRNLPCLKQQCTPRFRCSVSFSSCRHKKKNHVSCLLYLMLCSLLLL